MMAVEGIALISVGVVILVGYIYLMIVEHRSNKGGGYLNNAPFIEHVRREREEARRRETEAVTNELARIGQHMKQQEPTPEPGPKERRYI